MLAHTNLPLIHFDKNAITLKETKPGIIDMVSFPMTQQVQEILFTRVWFKQQAGGESEQSINKILQRHCIRLELPHQGRQFLHPERMESKEFYKVVQYNPQFRQNTQLENSVKYCIRSCNWNQTLSYIRIIKRFNR